MKTHWITLFSLIFLMSTCSMAEHDFYINKEYAGYNFASGKLGIAFYPHAPDFSEFAATFSEYHSGQTYQKFMENTIKTHLRKNVGFFGAEFVHDSFAVKSYEALIGKKTIHTFQIPENSVSLLQRFGVSFLMIISDYQAYAGTHDIQHYNRNEAEDLRDQYREKYGAKRYDKYEDDAFVFANSFWYILIDVLTGNPIQYGFVGSEDKAIRPTIEDWSESLTGCYESIVSDGILAKSRK